MAIFAPVLPEAPTPIVTPTPAPTPEPTPGSAGFSWVEDGLSEIEEEALAYLEGTRRKHLSVAAAIADEPWLHNGIDENDHFLLCTFARAGETALAEAILEKMVRPGATDLTGIDRFLPTCPKNCPETGAAQDGISVGTGAVPDRGSV